MEFEKTVVKKADFLGVGIEVLTEIEPQTDGTFYIWSRLITYWGVEPDHQIHGDKAYLRVIEEGQGDQPFCFPFLNEADARKAAQPYHELMIAVAQENEAFISLSTLAVIGGIDLG